MSEESSQINSYRVPKIPPFWTNDPETWFISVEAFFNVARISDDTTKFHIIVANVDASVLSHIKDLIVNPPTEDKYKAIKTRLLNAFSISQSAKLHQLLRAQSLGDRRSSHLLQELRNLAGGQCTDSMLKTVFIEQLPENYRVSLATIDEPDLNKFANIADKIADSLALNNSLAVVTATNHDAQAIASIGSLDDKIIDSLAKKIERKLKLYGTRKRSKSPNREARPTRSRSRSRGRRIICYYHDKFGSNAQKCRQPCDWINSNSPQGN